MVRYFSKRPKALPVILNYEQPFSRNPQLRATCILSQARVTIDEFQERFLRALVGLSLPGPHFRAALRIFGSEPVAFAIGSDHRDKIFF